jgi:hypothetical protein
MSGITYTMYHTTESFWEKRENISPHVYSLDGYVLTSRSFESTITIPEGMWVLESGGFGDDLLSRDDQPRNWVGWQRPRCINLGSPGQGLYLNHLMVCPEPFAIIRGVPHGKAWSGRRLTLLDVHEKSTGLRVECARQIHGDHYGKWVEVRDLPTSATEKRPFSRSLRWVRISDALEAAKMSPERLLLDYWPLIRREYDEWMNPTLNMLVADSREQIHGRVVEEAMRRRLPLEKVEQLVVDEATDWSQLWVPRGFLRDIMLLMQYNWHIPTRPKVRA